MVSYCCRHARHVYTIVAAKDFIRQLMCKDPKKRYTCQEAIEHPWSVCASSLRDVIRALVCTLACKHRPYRTVKTPVYTPSTWVYWWYMVPLWWNTRKVVWHHKKFVSASVFVWCDKSVVFCFAAQDIRKHRSQQEHSRVGIRANEKAFY